MSLQPVSPHTAMTSRQSGGPNEVSSSDAVMGIWAANPAAVGMHTQAALALNFATLLQCNHMHGVMHTTALLWLHARTPFPHAPQ